MDKSRRWPTVVDLFCGCGGVTAGLKSRHFRVVAAVDNNPVACETYRLNHPSTKLLEQDIADVDPDQIRRDHLLDLDLGVLVTCAPCQPFSSQNNRLGDDQRASLILQTIRFARSLKPKVIFFENDPGLASERFLPIIEELRAGLVSAGYVLGDPFRLNAADYGVPQRRIRCIMLAKYGEAPPDPPGPTTLDQNRVTVGQAIRDLPRLETGASDPSDSLHFARRHRPIALSRLAYIPKNGGSRDALPEELELHCHKGHKGHPDVYGRMCWDDVAPTLTTGCTDLTKGRFAHPEDDRAITLREAARLQSFDGDYAFAGSAKDIATQIGNAVPIRLIQEIAPTLRAALRS